MLNILSSILKDFSPTVIKENNTSELYYYSEIPSDKFREVLLAVTSSFKIYESRKNETQEYLCCEVGEELYYINYYEGIKELYVVRDNSRDYLSFKSPCGDVITTPTITQINLEDFGLSYAVRLSNGKFVVFDVGCDFPPDHEKLFNAIKKGSGTKAPTIAAWVLTHAHSDHFFGFVGFMNTYGEEIKVESMLFNFPEANDTDRFPGLASKDLRISPDASPIVYIPRTYEIINKYKINIFTPHTGQIYRIGDAVCEIVASMDDTIHSSTDLNATSTVIRMELGGQVILWGADASFSAAKLHKKQGKHLKSDILQIPHHGFGMGNEDVLIESYELIKPTTCLLPVSSYNAFTVFSTFKRSTRYLFTKLGVDEVIVGDPERTIALPYTPPEYAKHELMKAVASGIDNCGSRTWIFTGLNTGRPEDMKFTLLNLTHEKITVDAELFFEKKEYRVRFIRAEIDPYCMKEICFTDDTVKTEEVYFNPMSLGKVGLPESLPFSVRFMSVQPFIASHEKHKAAYYTPNIL